MENIGKLNLQWNSTLTYNYDTTLIALAHIHRAGRSYQRTGSHLKKILQQAASSPLYSRMLCLSRYIPSSTARNSLSHLIRLCRWRDRGDSISHRQVLCRSGPHNKRRLLGSLGCMHLSKLSSLITARESERKRQPNRLAKFSSYCLRFI